MFCFFVFLFGWISVMGELCEVRVTGRQYLSRFWAIGTVNIVELAVLVGRFGFGFVFWMRQSYEG